MIHTKFVHVISACKHEGEASRGDSIWSRAITA